MKKIDFSNNVVRLAALAVLGAVGVTAMKQFGKVAD